MTESPDLPFSPPEASFSGKAAVWLDLFERQPPPAAEDLAWAAAFTEQLQQRTADLAELARLQSITADFLASRRDLPPPNLQELNWVQELAQRDQAPSQAEETRLWDISARFLLEQEALLAAQLQGLEAARTAPSDAERAWAREQVSAAFQGKAPTQSDYQRFLKILKACQDFGQKL